VTGAPQQARDYGAMLRGMVGRMVVVSLLPLLVIGAANFFFFYRLNRSVVSERHATSLGTHRESIEAFLENLKAMASAMAHQYSEGELLTGSGLERLFEVIQHRAGALTDIGIIDSEGRHLKYVGPHNLAGRNYRGTEWFARVMQKGVYVSDVFLGFRGVPHFVIAVLRTEGARRWILRITVNTDYFSKLVDAARIGQTGETYIVNSAGLYQTKTRGGVLLGRADVPDLVQHEGIRLRETVSSGTRYLYTTTWLKDPRWLLIYRQQTSEVYAPLRHATLIGLLLFIAAAAAAVGLAVVVARSHVRQVRRTDEEREALTRQLLVTGKAAAIGEMSAGLAHEINNPLATIDALQTWIRDLAGGETVAGEDREELLASARKIGEQVVRCKRITQGLLHFARRVESQAEEVDLRVLIDELVAVEGARARVENVRLSAELEPLPRIFASPSHLQQILVNLVNNAIDACAGRPEGAVIIRARPEGDGVRLEICDNGTGIAAEHLGRIFMPFFTTKDVGRGTGLGLAICYGLVQDLGGSIEVQSQLGQGTTFQVSLPPRKAAS
jgi:two-component system, NtrC family, sensor kinase